MGAGSNLGNFEILFITASGTISENPSVVFCVDRNLFFGFVVYGYRNDLLRKIKKYILCRHVVVWFKLVSRFEKCTDLYWGRFQLGMWPNDSRMTRWD